METLKVVKTLKELEELTRYIEDKDYVGFDTETTGVIKGSHIIGFSVCSDIDVAYYVVLYRWDSISNNLVERETTKGAKSFLELLKTKKLILQNAVFDCSMVKDNFGVDLMPSVIHDTMLGGHILNENRSNGLKERGVELFGEDARAEQKAMKESVYKNGGVLTRDKYELYKADEDLLAYYGAKDAILTLKVFYNDVPQIYKEGLDKFFYDEESMSLLKGPTYDMNTEGLRVDPVKLQKLKQTLQADCLDAMGFITKEITHYVKDKYPGTGKSNNFNIGASQQRAWLLYDKLGNSFNTLTDSGRELCKSLGLKLPYTPAAKRTFIAIVRENKWKVWQEAKFNPKTKKMGRPKKVEDWWKYTACGKETLTKLAKKYKWVEKYLEYAKNLKLLNTYVEGIEKRMQYNVIRPNFLQHGTTSGRYACRNPNFQNLPRDDKRVKACIVAREGKVFVGADYAQLEPRVFASVSGDKNLMDCFSEGKDFYSVVGAPIFGKDGLPLEKDTPGSFAKRHPDLRDKAKIIALATPYGRTAAQQAAAMDIPREEAQELIENYFDAYPDVEKMMLDSHEEAKTNGVVFSLFGRPRRMPRATKIPQLFPKVKHEDLPYEWRNILNLSMNHKVQSTAASIMNRAAIAVWKECQVKGWTTVKIVLQVHDQLILEGPKELSKEMAKVLKRCMEETTELPGVKLIAEPFISNDLAGQK